MGGIEGAGDEFSREAICQGFREEEGFGPNGALEATPYEDGSYCGATFSEEYNADQLDELRNELDDGAELRRDGSGWLFVFPFSAEQFDSSEAASFGGENAFEGAEYIVRVRLPGEQVEHNGDYIDSEGYVVWDIDLTNPPADSLRLRTEPGNTIIGSQAPPASALSGGSGGGFVNYLLIGLAVLAVAAAAFWFLTQRNKSAASPEFGNSEPSVNRAPGIQAAGSPLAPTNPGTPVMPTTPQGGAHQTVIMNRAQEPAATPAAATTHGSTITPADATEPTWDPARGSYVQWDRANNRWLVYSDDTKAWAPEL